MAKSPKQILEESKTIAVVGASRDPGKPSGSVPVQMQRHGFRILPVNPHADVLFGEPVYRSLTDIKEPVDIVDVFRPSDDAPDVARQAVAIGARALWLQSGIYSDEARAIAEAGGLDYLEDCCIAVERSLHRIEKH